MLHKVVIYYTMIVDGDQGLTSFKMNNMLNAYLASKKIKNNCHGSQVVNFHPICSRPCDSYVLDLHAF